MRGAPQSGFSRLIRLINALTSWGTRGRPRRRGLDLQAQNNRKPIRCQPMTVSGLTTTTMSRQPGHKR